LVDIQEKITPGKDNRENMQKSLMNTITSILTRANTHQAGNEVDSEAHVWITTFQELHGCNNGITHLKEEGGRHHDLDRDEPC
jgi:hypothetical protein